MSISKGNFLSNFRFNNVTGALNPSDITDERQFVKEFEEFPSYFGFTLIETPRTDIMGITEVKRISDGQIFTHTSLSSIGTTEYFFDYTNEIPNVFFHASNVDEEFAIKYKGIGAAANAKNLLDISLLAAEMSRGLSSKFKRANTFDKIINGTNVYLLGKRATVRNCLIQGSNVIRGNVDGLTSFFEVYGDLTLERGSVIDTAGVIFIVHGSINVTGTGANPIFKGVDFVAGNAGAAGSMGGYTQMGGNGGAGGAGGKILESTGEDVGGDGGGGGGGGGFGWDGIVGEVGHGGIGVHGGANGADGTEAAFGFPGVGGAGGAGGSGGAGGAGSILFGAGGDAETGGAGVSGTNTDGSTGPPYTSGAGGAGGAGGASGGAGLIIICFVDIDSRIDFVSGKSTVGGQSGPITIISKYTSLPNVLDVAGGAGGGIDGVLSLIDVSNRSDINEHYLNQFWYFNTGSISI